MNIQLLKIYNNNIVNIIRNYLMISKSELLEYKQDYIKELLIRTNNIKEILDTTYKLSNYNLKSNRYKFRWAVCYNWEFRYNWNYVKSYYEFPLF